MIGDELTDDGKAFLEACERDSWSSSKYFARCGWCRDHIHELVGVPGPRSLGKTSKFCDEDCLALWLRTQHVEPPIAWEDRPLFNPVGGTVDAQRRRQEEKEEADETDGVEMMLRLDDLALDRLMKVTYWLFTWPDGGVSLIAAESREEAVAALSEAGQRNPEDLRPVPDFRLGEFIHDQEVDLVRHKIKLRV